MIQISNDSRGLIVQTSNPQIVCAADDNYAMCLAVMTASLISNCKESDSLSLFVLDGGISPENKEKLYQGWKNSNLEVHWVVPDAHCLAGLPVSDHVNIITYYRMLLGEVLPIEIDKVIYLDCDLVVEDDVCQLWNEPFENNLCLAVQDVAAPFLDSEIALENYSSYWRIKAVPRPVANYSELSMDPAAAYFNAGVMMIDLNRWRRESIQNQLLDCLKVNAEYVQFWDQYALNVVLYGNWRMINPRWNQTPHLYHYSKWQESPLDEVNYIAATTNPGIIHYASPVKPWHFLYWYPGKSNFYKYLAKTAWAGWRPKISKLDIVRFKRYYLSVKRSQLKQSIENLVIGFGSR